MNTAPLSILLLSLCFNSAFADSYFDEVQNALNQLQESKNILGEFDIKTLPNFDANPKEQSHKPSQKGELEQKGKQFISQD